VLLVADISTVQATSAERTCDKGQVDQYHGRNNGLKLKYDVTSNTGDKNGAL